MSRIFLIKFYNKICVYPKLELKRTEWEMIQKRWTNKVIGFVLVLGMLGGCAETLAEKMNSSSVERGRMEEKVSKRAIRGIQLLEHVVISENGYYKPAACYNWRYPDISYDYKVIPLNVHWENRGWYPDEGYKWAAPDDDQDLCVVKYNENWFRDWLNASETRIKRDKRK
jgi:hypothetical protein